MSSPLYDQTRSIPLPGPFKRWLCFDVFQARHSVHLIMTFWPDEIMKASAIKVSQKCGSEWKKLHIFERIEKRTYEPSRVYTFPLKKNGSIVHVCIQYKEKIVCMDLPSDEDAAYPDDAPAIATLFQHDFHLAPAWISHHKALGFKYFYLFYNGTGFTPKLPFSDPRVRLLEWNFPYWTDGNVLSDSGAPSALWNCKIRDRKAVKNWHSAQTTFLSMMLYKYAFRHEFILFSDLDEFIKPWGQAGVFDALRADPRSAGVVVPSHWAIAPDEGETKILRNSFSEGDQRMKSLIRPEMVKTMNVHHPHKFSGTLIPWEQSPLYLLHLIDKTNTGRTPLVKNGFEDHLYQDSSQASPLLPKDSSK